MAELAEIITGELTPAETETLVDRIATDIVSRGMETPAILLLESHKPLAGLVGPASIVFAPFALPFVGFDRYADFGRLFARRENIDRLLERIEAMTAAGKEA